MKAFSTISMSIGLIICATAQDGMRNLGMLQIHPDGGIGFHGDLANEAAWDQNLGLVGFYGNSSSVTGFFEPVFNDVEIMVPNEFYLDISLGIQGNFNFISGDVNTPKSNPFISLDFHSGSFHNGSGNISKVNGYVTMQEKQDFIFPVGDSEYLRPLILQSQASNPIVTCAYYFEDPNNPALLPTSFNTNAKASEIINISTKEFWFLQGTVPSTVQLSWNQRSTIGLLVGEVNKIILVGWHKATHSWNSLGGTALGDLEQGFVISESFNPQDYEVITFGSINEPEILVDLPNYLLTPNGDGINDFLEIPELVSYPNNLVQIYDRNGLLVFEKDNYTYQFNGYATEGDMVINRNKGLPSGVYFYLVTIQDFDLEYQGFLYLAKD